MEQNIQIVQYILFDTGIEVKKNIISGGCALFLGLLIALGPQFLFKVCDTQSGEIFRCYWMARCEICTGILIAALGVCLMIFSSPKINLGLTIGIFLTGIVALLIPYEQLTGICAEAEAHCRRAAFPALNILSVMVVLGAVISMICLERKTRT